MRIALSVLLPLLLLLVGCQTKGEKKAPCPPITSYVEADDLCGPAYPVNDAFNSVLRE